MFKKLIVEYYFITNVCSMIIRDDVDPSIYTGVASNYPAVFPYPDTMPPGLGCAATLITESIALTAAHCFDEISTPFTVTIAGVRHMVSNVVINPCFDFDNDGPNGMDLAILKLDTPSAVNPIMVYTDGDEVGKIFTLVGWGDLGIADGDEPSDGDGGNIFRVGQNIITKISENTLQYSLDRNFNGGLELEAIGWYGDSGGPALIQKYGKTYIAGVNSGGDCCDYGSVDEFCRLSSAISQDFIRKAMDDNSHHLDDEYSCDTNSAGSRLRFLKIYG